jgi:hypothetical protein
LISVETLPKECSRFVGVFFEGAELFSFRVEPTPSPAGCPTYRVALVGWPALAAFIDA